MKKLYRLRFIPLVLFIIFFLGSILGLLGYLSIMSVVALPYQDPTSELLLVQEEMLQVLSDGVGRVVGLVVLAISALVLYICFLIFLHYRRKKRIASDSQLLQHNTK